MTNTTEQARTDEQVSEQEEFRGGALAVRGIIGGTLMGLANLVPGISGGTMLLAAGVYPQFVNGVADVSTLRFRRRSMAMLACIAGAAAVAIVAGAGPISGLVINHRWIMYSLFIGLTLGGLPILYAMARPLDAGVLVGAVVGLGLMVAMAFVDTGSAGAGTGSHPYAMYFIAGLAGAAAMVLPGVSGGYLLLILGQYVTILMAVSALEDAVSARDWASATDTLHVIVPVGIGVVLGIVGVSNLVKWLLVRFERATLGVLMGLLLGAVIGLWPFQEGAPPAVGSTFRGDTVTLIDDGLVMETTGRPIEAHDYPTEMFRPSVMQVASAIGFIALGFTASTLVSRFGGRGSRGKTG